jgi:hypothetical protein
MNLFSDRKKKSRSSSAFATVADALNYLLNVSYLSMLLSKTLRVRKT